MISNYFKSIFELRWVEELLASSHLIKYSDIRVQMQSESDLDTIVDFNYRGYTTLSCDDYEHKVELIWSDKFIAAVERMDDSLFAEIVKQTIEVVGNDDISKEFSGQWLVIKTLVSSFTDQHIARLAKDQTDKLLSKIDESNIAEIFQRQVRLLADGGKLGFILWDIMITRITNCMSLDDDDGEETKFTELFEKDLLIHAQLLKRKRNGHLTLVQRGYLARLLTRYNNMHSIISKMYKLSESTMSRLKILRRNPVKLMKLHKDYEHQLQQIPGTARKWIQKIINPPKPPLTLAKIQQQVQMTWGEEIRKRDLKKFIKQDLRYSYKRGSARPPQAVQPTSADANALFWARILSEIYEGKLIVNVNEWGFSRMMKSNYSYLPSGGGGAILNDRHKGRCNLILGIFSDGEWIGLIKEDTTKAFDYWLYLALMLHIIKQSGIDTTKELSVMQDNCAWHHSVQVNRLSNSEHMLMHFLPSYQPTLAGV